MTESWTLEIKPCSPSTVTAWMGVLQDSNLGVCCGNTWGSASEEPHPGPSIF